MLADLLQRLKQQLAGRGFGASDDIDVLIERIGARHTAEDRRRAYAMFLGNALYAPVVSMKAAKPATGRSKAAAASKKKAKKAAAKKKKKTAAKKSAARSEDAGLQHHMNLAMAGVNGFQMFLMYTSGEDERLVQGGEHRLELPGRRAFEMALETEGVDGLLIHNKRNSWMALPNELVREILEVFPEDS